MRTISQWLRQVGSGRGTTAAPVQPTDSLGEAELDQAAAAGGSSSRGLGSGSGGNRAAWLPPLDLN
jgi:hypothetical protein